MTTKRTGRMSDEAVRAKTGRRWPEWFALLDEAGAAALPHKEIAVLLGERHGVPGWWAQTVTVEYERERGLRDVHQTSRGYEVSVSKTIGVPVQALFAAWHEAAQRERWLHDAASIRTATAPKSLRLDFDGGSANIAINLYVKGQSRSQVVVQHSKLATAGDVEERRAYWREALDRLAAVV